MLTFIIFSLSRRVCSREIARNSTHTHTHEISKVKKRTSGQKIVRREEVLDTRAAAEAAAHFCVSDIHLPLNVYLFFPPKDMEA